MPQKIPNCLSPTNLRTLQAFLSANGKQAITADIITLLQHEDTALWALYYCTRYGMINSLKLSLQYSPPAITINSRSQEQDSLALYACVYNQFEVLVYIHTQGCDLDHQCSWGGAPIHIASITAGHENMLRYLLEVADVDVDTRCQVSGSTPLQKAAFANNIGAITILLEYNPRIDLADISDKNPVIIALKRNNSESAQLLITHLLIKKDPHEVDIFFQRILAGQDHLNDHSLILLHRTINTCRTALANLEEDQPRASWCSYLSPMTLFRSVRNAAHQAASALTENTFS